MHLRFTPLALTLALWGAPLLAAPVDIPAGPLAPALTRYAQQQGLHLSVDAALLAGKTTAGLHGEVAPRAGLQQLIQDAELDIVEDSYGNLSLRARPLVTLPVVNVTSIRPLAVVASAGAVTLPTVEVKANSESATGPVAGYVARKTGSAGKSEQDVTETVQGVAIITRDQLQDQAAQSVSEATRYTAGVRPFDSALTDDDVVVRGFNLTGAGLYRDGMRYVHNGFMANLEMYGLERLEIIKGPASVTYGQSAPGGIVNAVSKRPHAQQQNEVQLTAGSHQLWQGAVDVGGQLSSDGSTLFRLTALAREANTQWDYLENNRLYVAPAISWQNERSKLTLLAQYQRDDSGFIAPYYLETKAGPSKNSLNVAGPGSGHHKESWSFTAEGEHQLQPGLTLRAKARYMDGENQRYEIRNRGLASDGRSINRLGMVRPDDEQSWSGDLHLESQFATGALQHTLTSGVDYYDSTLNLRIFSLNGKVAPLDLVQPAYSAPNWQDNYLTDHYIAQQQQTGLYLQDQIRLGNWLFSLGGRYDRVKTDTDYDARLTAKDAFKRSTFRRDDEAFTGRAGVVYQHASGLSPYASFSTSFQPVLSTTTAVDAYGAPFQPETGRQLEAGVRYAPAGLNALLTASYFDLTKRNVRTQSTENPRLEVQTGEIRSRGLELEAKGEVLPNFNLIANYAFIDAEVTRSNRPGEAGGSPAYVPKHNASVWGKYSWAGWELGAGLRHVRDIPGDVRQANGQQPMDDNYTVVDALLAYQFKQWRAALNVSNLFDHEYRSQCSVQRGGQTFCTIGYGRDVRASVSYRW
ncbi:TonB-dependent siderophore receptor [Chitinibacter sp. ZOR0017]|uniref:TonB-dependent siderophore receptor n=1 Tax=Chitinibacter sp. ZOR0017 TaxID=1339254 RepID=UPI0018CEEAB7|nr:TonB-dependent siderophore receptor [Chitinibacter sp. ZOR0017]